MFLHNFLIAFRNVFRQRALASINILGLTLGMSCFILILLFIQDELSYDKHHVNADRIYRITEIIRPAEHSSSQPFSVAPTLVNEYPAMIEHAVRFFNMQAPTLTVDRGEDLRFAESRFFFVDSTVFDVFTFPFIKGDPVTALDEPYSVVITEPIARKYFGDEDAIGKTLTFEGQHELKVTGIIHAVPKTSHLQFDFLASFSTVTGIQNGVRPEGWNWNPCWTYLLLTQGTLPEQLQVRLPGFVEKFFPDNIHERTSLHLQPLTDIHLHSHLDYEIRPNSDIQYVYIFSAIALFILLIAAINYMNLATARASRRSVEVGVKKVLGADRAVLIRQFLSESLIMSLFAALLTIPVVSLALPSLNAFLDKSLSLEFITNPIMSAAFLGSVIFIGFLAGIYPAFVLSGFSPSQIFQNRVFSTGFDWTAFVRKSLVVFQFVISIGLIIGTLVVYNQLQFVRGKNLGFDKEQVMMVNMFRSNLAARYDDLKARLLAQRDVLYVTTAEDVLGSKYQTNPFKPEGSAEFVQFQRLMVGFDFVETFNLELVTGRPFQDEFITDDSLAVLINESMVRHLDWGTAEQALGMGFKGPRRTQRVVGVLKDFHYTSLHSPIGPFVLDIADTESQHNFFDRYLAIRIAPQNFQATLGHIKDVWAEFMPDRPFEFFFMDEALNNLYRAEQRLSQVAGLFTVFALLVACIGLLGIAMFVIETKTKEISIRKVLGASVQQIMFLLSRDFLRPVLIANFVAWPLVWYFLDRWLDHFAYRAQIHWWFFVAAAALSLAIALITVSLQVVRSANIDPAAVLKGE